MLIRYWAGEDVAVVFSPRSTNTHLVSALAGELLRLASGQPLTPTQLVDALDAEADTQAAVAGVLDGLLAAGLLRPAS